MGLLSKFRGTEPAKKPTDDVLLLHAIICMCAADGMIEDAEHEMIRNYANTLPEFRDMDGQEFSNCIQGSAKIAQKYNKDMKSSLQALAEIQSDAVSARRAAWQLRADQRHRARRRRRVVCGASGRPTCVQRTAASATRRHLWRRC